MGRRYINRGTITLKRPGAGLVNRMVGRGLVVCPTGVKNNGTRMARVNVDTGCTDLVVVVANVLRGVFANDISTFICHVINEVHCARSTKGRKLEQESAEKMIGGVFIVASVLCLRLLILVGGAGRVRALKAFRKA